MLKSTSQTVTKRWFYLRIFACFWMLSILLVLLLSFVSYSVSSNLLKKEINRSNSIILDYLQNKIDSSLSSIKKDVISYRSFDPSVNTFTVNSDPASNAYLSSIICKDLSQLKSVNPYISDIVFYSRNKDYVITAEGSTKSSFYFHLYPDNHFEDFLDSAVLWESFYINSYRTATLTFDAVIFCTALPANSVKPSALLCIALDKQQLWNDVNSFDLTQNGFVLITDRDDNVILNYSPDNLPLPVDKEIVREARQQSSVSIGNQKYLSIPVTSPDNGWNYIALIPYSEISSKTSSIQYTSFFLCAAMTAVSLLLSLLVSHRLYAPVSALVRNVAASRNPNPSGGGSDRHDEFSFLQNNIDNMILENQDLQDSFLKTVPLIQQSFLKSLLHGQFNSEELPEKTENYHISLPNQYITVFLFHPKAPCDAAQIDRIFQESFTCFYSIDEGSHITVLMNFNECGISELTEKFSKLPAAVAQGGVYPGLINIPKSYHQALYALQYRTASACFEFLSIPGLLQKDFSRYQLSSQFDDHFFNCLKVCDFESAARLVRTASDQFYTEYTPYFFLEQITGRLYNLAVKASGQNDIPNASVNRELLDYRTEKDQLLRPEDHAAYIQALFENLFHFLKSSQSGQTDKEHELITQVLHVLDERYSEDLSLESLADQFEISYSYLSKLFKETVGEGYSKYITRLRMEHAIELLKDPDLTVDTISLQVGYTNTPTFIRNFKKVTGISPGRYRQKE